MTNALAYVSLGFVLASVIGWRIAVVRTRRCAEGLTRALVTLRRGEAGSIENDGSAAFDVVHEELGALRRALQKREQELAQREALLRALVESAPMASLLLTSGGTIVYTNRTARQLFFGGGEPESGDFLALLERAPEALRRAVAAEGDELFSIDDDDQARQVYHLAKRHFDLDGEPMVLVVVNNLTRELHKQEADVWKRMIRIMAHELNNSLAPISSLVHSARIVTRGSTHETELAIVFDTIAERSEHLRSFLEGFSQFARLPVPRKVDVAWKPFLDRLSTLFPRLRIEGEVPAATGWFDPGQIEQVLINLVKNAEEASPPGEAVTLVVGNKEPDSTRLVVRDRGKGMSPEVMKNALVPFYSTKERGTGLGLPLCREIVEGHGGVLRLESRDGGGLDVVVRLPSRNRASNGVGKLTLTRS